MPYLVYAENEYNRAIPITNEDTGFCIGRSMENDVRLREDSSVSRKHCIIFRDESSREYILRDLNSSNGTYLNEYCLQNQQCPVRDGDSIGVGNLAFIFYSNPDIPYELVDTTTIYVRKPVPDMSPPNEYPFKDTTRLEAITPTSSSREAGEDDCAYPEIEGFEFIRIIGGGNYSTTYLVFQPGLKRSVVLKTFHTGDISESQKSNFRQQVGTASQLSHPNILGFIDAGITDSLCYVVMPYAPQGTMADLISRFKDGIGEKDAADYMLPLIEAMIYASEKGLYHADICPPNILFDENSHPVIADFGLSPWIGSVFQPERNFFFGSTEHMPPEQTLDKSLDWTCDQYAFGGLFYELLTGKPPFSAPSAYALIEKHLREKVRFPDSLKISEKYREIIVHMMAKTPGERFSSWRDIMNAFTAKASIKSKKNVPPQKKGFSKIKKTGAGIKIAAKKKHIPIKRR